MIWLDIRNGFVSFLIDSFCGEPIYLQSFFKAMGV